MRLARILLILMIAYPVTKLTGLFPADELVELAESTFGAERASSLGDRMRNDKVLMSKANDKVLFGWGPFGRARVTDDLGQDVAPPDGWWIITLGQCGSVVLFSIFALLLWPVWLAGSVLPKLKDKRQQALLATFALSTVLFAFDGLPNNIYNALPLVFSGAFVGSCHGLLKQKKPAKARAVAVAEGPGMAPVAAARPVG
jgi:hypothetical protein